MTYLEDYPPRIRQFRSPRRAKPSGVMVVHTAEWLPDWAGLDGAAEATADFIVRRTTYGSYHDLCDSDSIIQLVPYSAEAFHDGTGSNPHSYGVSAATQAAKWMAAPSTWRDLTVRNMAKASARYARWIRTEHGVIVPARRITRAQSEDRVPGFLSHAERDPDRRTDPGKSFPWSDFLAYYAAEMKATTTTNGEDDEMAFTIHELLNTPLGTKTKKGEPVTVGSALRAAAWLAEENMEGGEIDLQADRIEEQTK
jgi:hypothetical protein